MPNTEFLYKNKLYCIKKGMKLCNRIYSGVSRLSHYLII